MTSLLLFFFFFLAGTYNFSLSMFGPWGRRRWCEEKMGFADCSFCVVLCVLAQCSPAFSSCALCFSVGLRILCYTDVVRTHSTRIHGPLSTEIFFFFSFSFSRVTNIVTPSHHTACLYCFLDKKIVPQPSDLRCIRICTLLCIQPRCLILFCFEFFFLWICMRVCARWLYAHTHTLVKE